MKRLTGKSTKPKPIRPIMNEQKELVFGDSDTFNVFFSTIGKELAKSSHRGRLTVAKENSWGRQLVGKRNDNLWN